MTKYVYNEDGEVIGEYLEEVRHSRIKGALKSIGGEIKGFHQMMLRKRAEASRRNEMINKMNRGGRRMVMRDENVLHTHLHTKIGW